ncbi:hypothetical protein MHYP_G00343200 [Metynnis hypsauchen]
MQEHREGKISSAIYKVVHLNCTGKEAGGHFLTDISRSGVPPRKEFESHNVQRGFNPLRAARSQACMEVHFAILVEHKTSLLACDVACTIFSIKPKAAKPSPPAS